MATAVDFASLKDEYKRLWETCVIVPERRAILRSRARKLLEGLETYREVERLTGVPAVVVMAIHDRESGGDFGTYLGNGQSLSRITTIEPKNRGPFKTFIDGAVDALVYQGYTSIGPWTIEKALWAFEKFNGFGYRYKHLNSPYLWGATNHQQVGKYVADGDFRPTVWDTQLGAAAVMLALVQEYPPLAIGAAPSPVPAPGGTNPPAEPENPPRGFPWLWDLIKAILNFFGVKT